MHRLSGRIQRRSFIIEPMKLYLSSYHLGNTPAKLAEMVGNNKTIAIIPNALDVYTDIPRRIAGIEQEKKDLQHIGLLPEELDLRLYFGKPEELARKMNSFGGVWVLGGNTFTLRRAFKESGFDTWLQNNKGNKDFVYAGYSAGICILSPELKSIAMIDEPYNVPNGYQPDVIWEGLGFVDYIFAPHFQSNHPESPLVDQQVEYLKRNNINYKTLHDGEVVITEV